MNETEYIHQRIEEGEHDRQDFKFAISDARKIARSISAFANTAGGSLLVGVKDNGKIAGVRSEEEMYMIEAAAQMYCDPPVVVESRLYRVEGKEVLEVVVPEAGTKPVYALDESGKRWAYVRVADENILATPVHLEVWKHDRRDRQVVMAYTERERHLLEVLSLHGTLSLNRCARLAGIPRREACLLLAGFIRFGLVEFSFQDHAFSFCLADDPEGDGGK